MSMLGDVIKNKNKVDKLRRTKRKDEIVKLKIQTAFKAKMYDELKKIDVLLDSEGVEAVIISVPEAMQSNFMTALYSDDLSDYDITQVEGTPNKFYVKRKFITF